MTNLSANTNLPQTDQGLLFITPSENPAGKSYLAVKKPEPTTTVSSPPPSKPSVTTLPREELLERIFQSNCHHSHRRWEKELLFGATDAELSISMGNSFHFGEEINLRFQTNSEPALTVTYRVFDVEVTTASFAEVAAYVRRIAQIPERKSDQEHAQLLAIKLDEIRAERRQEITSYVRSLTGEKYHATARKKKKGPAETENRPPPLTGQITDLLYAPDCMTEASDRKLLIKITRLLNRNANVEILKAAESAVQIIKRAQSDWRCYTAYWTGDDQKPRETAYKQGKETTKGSEPAPP